MADENNVRKVNQTQKQESADKFFTAKANKMQEHKVHKMFALKKKNNLIGLLLGGGVLGIYGYTLYSVRQGKMMEAFDKTPE